MEDIKPRASSWSREKLILAGCTVFLILNAIDGALTLWGLGLGAIEEVNPLMQWLIEKSPYVFMASKLFLPIILGLVLWRIRSRSFITYSLGVILAVYLVVMVFHAYWVITYY